MDRIREMLNPRSVALIGATEKENSVGRTVLTNLLHGSNRFVYPVNPGRQTVLGAPCFPSITDLPAHVDLAVIAAPAAAVPGLVRECGEAGVSGAIILSAGFGKADPRERELEKEIIHVRRKCGMRVIGPNCLGVILPHIGLNTTFLATNPKPGKIALISRALGDAILDWGGTMGIGFSMFASLGSMIDVGYGDLIDFLTDDYRTRSMMIYMENVGDARRFISAARGFALSKPIVVLKPGRSRAGARFISTRAGGPAGDDRVYDAVFKRVGAARVREVSDLLNMAGVLDSPRLPRGPRLAIITNAGDVGILAADTLTELGGTLAGLSGNDTDKLDLYLPEQWTRDDPVDIGGTTDTGRYMNTIEACLGDAGVDGILVIYTPRAAAQTTDLARALIDISRKTAKPVIVTWIGGEHAAEGRRILLQNNVPAYATPEEAVKTYLYMYGYRRNIELLYETPAEVAQKDPPLKNYLKTIIRKAVTEGRPLLGAEASLDLLRNYRIGTAKTAVVGNVDQIPGQARKLGFPVSLTIRYLREGRDGRAVSLSGEEEIDRVCGEVRRNLHGQGLIEGQDMEIILQKMTDPQALRLKVASRRDTEFRTVLVLSPDTGNGDDAAIGLPPLNKTLARRFLEGTPVYHTLSCTGPGQETIGKLEDVLLSFSDLVIDFGEIESFEFVLSIGKSDVLAQEVSVVPSRHYDDSRSYPHLVITPYPSRYMTAWNLPDGTDVLLRPVRPEDESMVREMLDSLSEETLRVRYFTVREIDHDLLIRSCNIDYDREVAIIAEIKHTGGKKMVGGARLIREPGSARGQFAILVHDDYQGMGLGAKLIDTLIGIAHDKRLEEMYGLVLTENQRMLALAAKFGFELKREPEGISRVTLSFTT